MRLYYFNGDRASAVVIADSLPMAWCAMFERFGSKYSPLYDTLPHHNQWYNDWEFVCSRPIPTESTVVDYYIE